MRRWRCGWPHPKTQGGSLLDPCGAGQAFAMRRISGSVPVVIVGAGPAGLAASSRLAGLGFPHVVLERDRVGWSWRAQRWDAFRLNTPRWVNRALGKSLAGGPDTFASADAVVEALEQSAKRLPVAEGVEVFSARRIGPRWRLDTSRGAIAADAIVVASGFQNVPRIPREAADVPKELRQLHVADYRGPGALDDGVLVVGVRPIRGTDRGGLGRRRQTRVSLHQSRWPSAPALRSPRCVRMAARDR